LAWDARCTPSSHCLLDLLALYAALRPGVGGGVRSPSASSRVQGRAAMSPGGPLILILPGARALWPYVVIRWLEAEKP
jgi:hypothetical protein